MTTSTTTSHAADRSLQQTKRQKTLDLFLEDHKRLVACRSDHDPAWLADIRDTGIKRFEQLGFPTRKDEDWRDKEGAIAEARRGATKRSRDANPGYAGLQILDEITAQRDLVFTGLRSAGPKRARRRGSSRPFGAWLRGSFLRLRRGLRRPQR